jgi:hypothetical protein
VVCECSRWLGAGATADQRARSGISILLVPRYNTAVRRGHPPREVRVEGVVVDRADRVDQRPDDLAPPGAPDHPRRLEQRVPVVHRVQDDEARHAVRDEAVVGELHEVRVDRLPRDEAQPGADELQRRVRHRRVRQADPLPRVLAMGAHGDPHVRAGREVERA